MYLLQAPGRTIFAITHRCTEAPTWNLIKTLEPPSQWIQQPGLEVTILFNSIQNRNLTYRLTGAHGWLLILWCWLPHCGWRLPIFIPAWFVCLRPRVEWAVAHLFFKWRWGIKVKGEAGLPAEVGWLMEGGGGTQGPRGLKGNLRLVSSIRVSSPWLSAMASADGHCPLTGPASSLMNSTTDL